MIVTIVVNNTMMKTWGGSGREPACAEEAQAALEADYHHNLPFVLLRK